LQQIAEVAGTTGALLPQLGRGGAAPLAASHGMQREAALLRPDHTVSRHELVSSREKIGRPAVPTWGVCFAAMWSLLALLLLGIAGARVFLGYPRPEAPTEALSRREMATLAAVSEALFPAGGAVAPSGADAGVADYIDRLVAASQPQQRRLMRALFFLIEHATLFFPAPGGLSGLRRFSSLDSEQRVAVVESWQRSNLLLRRIVFTSLRALCTLGYLADPTVLRALQLAPYAVDTPIVEADLLYPRIGEPSDSVRLTRRDLSGDRAAPPLDLAGPLLQGYSEERS